MDCILFNDKRAKFNKLRLPVFLLVLFVFYYAFVSLFQSTFIFSDSGKTVVGLMLSYSSLAFLGINCFIVLSVTKSSFKNMKALYAVCLFGSAILALTYGILFSMMVNDYSALIFSKASVIINYFQQIIDLKALSIAFYSYATISMIIFVVVAIAIICIIISNVRPTIVCNSSTNGCIYKETILKNESFGFLYFAIS